jgi:hypothetical protein
VACDVRRAQQRRRAAIFAAGAARAPIARGEQTCLRREATPGGDEMQRFHGRTRPTCEARHNSPECNFTLGDKPAGRGKELGQRRLLRRVDL